MLIIPQPTIRRRGRVIQPAGSPTPPPPPGQPLICVDAIYELDSQALSLQFDREVDVSGFVGSQLTVSDGTGNHRVYTGGAASVPSDNQVWILLVAGDAYEGDDVVLNASGLTGLKAVDDGGLWAGAVDLELPFGG